MYLNKICFEALGFTKDQAYCLALGLNNISYYHLNYDIMTKLNR